MVFFAKCTRAWSSHVKISYPEKNLGTCKTDEKDHLPTLFFLLSKNFTVGERVSMIKIQFKYYQFRGVSSYLKLGGKLVMRCAIAAQWYLLLCQKQGRQLPSLSTCQLRPCTLKITGAKMFLRHIVYIVIGQLNFQWTKNICNFKSQVMH